MARRPTRPATPQISGSTTIPAPTGGLNAISPISNMDESDAIIMRNFFPEPFGVRVRKGYIEHATGLDGPVSSILLYNGQDGTNKVFSVDMTQVMDVTIPGDYANGTPICHSTNPWWQSIQIANPTGTHMIAFNGVDDGIVYSSDGVHRLVAGDGIAAYTWSGIDPKKLVLPIVHQSRLWAVEVDSTKAWYLPSQQIYGVAKFFDFGANFQRGGFLQALVVYTQDSGYGPDDYIVAISSAGECVIYKGIDPEGADTWALVGVFYIGATFTRRCTARFGGDVAILTQYGLITVGSITKPTEYSVLDNALSQKIQYLISEVVIEGSYRQGWTVVFHPAANMMIVNVPGVVPEQNFQLAYNTLTKAWCQFSGMLAYCWKSSTDVLFFAGTRPGTKPPSLRNTSTAGVVYRAWEGYLDSVSLAGTNGVPVKAECQQAFSYFKLPGASKHFKMFRPTFLYDGKFDFQAGANMNFDFATVPPPASFNTSNFGVWNQSLWDDTDVWSGGSQSDKQWISIVGIGYAAAVRLAVTTSSNTVWVSTDWLMEKGGVV